MGRLKLKTKPLVKCCRWVSGGASSAMLTGSTLRSSTSTTSCTQGWWWCHGSVKLRVSEKLQGLGILSWHGLKRKYPLRKKSWSAILLVWATPGDSNLHNCTVQYKDKISALFYDNLISVATSRVLVQRRVQPNHFYAHPVIFSNLSLISIITFFELPFLHPTPYPFQYYCIYCRYLILFFTLFNEMILFPLFPLSQYFYLFYFIPNIFSIRHTFRCQAVPTLSFWTNILYLNYFLFLAI